MSILHLFREPEWRMLLQQTALSQQTASSQQTAPGPLQEFHRFQKLPTELRCMIYNLAIPRRVFIFGPPTIKIYDAFQINLKAFVDIEPAIAGARKEAWGYIELFRDTFQQIATFHGLRVQPLPQILRSLIRSHRIQKRHDMLLLNAVPVESSRVNLPPQTLTQRIALHLERETHMDAFLEACKHFQVTPCLDLYLFFPDEASYYHHHGCDEYHFRPERELLRLGKEYPEYQVAIHQYRIVLPSDCPEARAEFLELIHDSPMIDLQDIGMLFRWLSFLLVWYGSNNGLFYILGPWWYHEQGWGDSSPGFLAKSFRLGIEKIWVWCCAKRDGRLHDQSIWNRPPGHDKYISPRPALLPTPALLFFSNGPGRDKWHDPNHDWVKEQLAAMPQFKPAVLVQLCK